MRLIVSLLCLFAVDHHVRFVYYRCFVVYMCALARTELECIVHTEQICNGQVRRVIDCDFRELEAKLDDWLDMLFG